MKRVENPAVIDYAQLKNQQIPTLASRNSQSRGLVTAFTGTMIGMGVSAVKQMIAKEGNKYRAEWNAGLNSLYFYDQMSSDGPFDPIGLQFNGFSIERTITDDQGQQQTAVRAVFELDTTNVYEIFNNATFRLRMKDIAVNYSKAKIPAGKKTINIDMEISFNTSYINADGNLFRNVELGKFYVRLRNAPLDKNDPAYEEYYRKLRNTEIEGRSFIVPRSYGYHMANRNRMEPSWNQGAYSIAVKVTESAKNTFVNQVIMDTSGVLIDMESDRVNDLIKTKIEQGKNK